MQRKEIEMERNKRYLFQRCNILKEKKIQELKDEIQKFQQISVRVENLRNLVYKELNPAKKAIINMQKLIITLFKQLGHDDFNAWFKTYWEIQDWDELSDLVTLYQVHGDSFFKATGSVKPKEIEKKFLRQ